MQDDIEQKPIAIRFTRNLDLSIIDCTKPIPFEADRFIKDDKWSDEELSNCIALVPVTYINAGEYVNVLPLHLPVYSWGYGSSTVDITRTYKDKPTQFRLVGDVVWAKISQSLLSNYREQHNKESTKMSNEQKQSAGTEPKTISYPEAFFYDVTNQILISDATEETRHNVEVVYNSFKDILDMDHESKITITREKMLSLEYFQLFMLIMHEMQFFWKIRMSEEDPGPENITYSFNTVMIRFCKHAYHVRNYPSDTSTWDELEIDLNGTRDDVNTLLTLIMDYCIGEDPEEDDQLPPSPSEINIPTSDEIEDNEPGENLETKFKEQEIMQDMDLSHAHWSSEKLMMALRVTINLFVMATLGVMVIKLWMFMFAENGDGHNFTDAEMGSIMLTIIFIVIVNNIKTIFGWFKEIINHG